MSELGPSPLAAGDKNLSVAQAREAIAAALRPITQGEDVPVAQALGRVLAADVISPIDVPAHDNSAMDGYAFDGRALRPDGPTLLRPVGTLMAGAPYAGTVGPGECLRIMTGAVMPTGLDTVVPLELCRAEGALVHVEAGVIRAGENRRRRGEDLAAGRPAVQAGRLLKPADMGLIASLGVERVPVFRRLRVALFSTGDEMRTLGQPLDPGCVYDSNRYSLMGALQRLGMEVVDLGLVRDDPQALHGVLEQAMARADAVVTSGGVSMGDADYTRDVLAQLGQVAFWKVAMRPGRPFAFGPLRRQAPADGSTAAVAAAQAPVWLFALPGNPVAALVTFYVFAREALLQPGGCHRQRPCRCCRHAALTPIRKRPGRTEFQRAIVESCARQGWQVRLTGSQGAGVLRSMSEANALVVLGHEQALGGGR